MPTKSQSQDLINNEAHQLNVKQKGPFPCRYEVVYGFEINGTIAWTSANCTHAVDTSEDDAPNRTNFNSFVSLNSDSSDPGALAAMIREKELRYGLIVVIGIIILSCLVGLCNTVISTTAPSKPCKKAQIFVSKHNASVDTLLAQHHLESAPFKRGEMVPAFVGYSENYLVEPKYNLLTCNIPKVLSTIRVGLFWLLHNETSYDASNYTLSLGDWDFLYTLPAAQELLQVGYTSFLVHRDPIERFVSGYIDKCINSKACYDCNENVTCFVQEQYKRFMLYGNGYRLDIDHGLEDFHFVPQTWLCRLNETFYDYQQIKYESGDKLEKMVEDMLQVLKDTCVEEPLLQRIRTELMEGKTGHTTRGSESRSKYEDEIRNNTEAADLLMKMYYYDYVAFGYPLPSGGV